MNLMRMLCWMLVVIAFLFASNAYSQESLAPLVERIQPKMVKITGAGGARRMEAYLTGVLISGEGHTEIAVLKIAAETPDYFDPTQAVELQPGASILAFSNVYGVALVDTAPSEPLELENDPVRRLMVWFAASPAMKRTREFTATRERLSTSKVPFLEADLPENRELNAAELH